jgi:hypothetical protein
MRLFIGILGGLVILSGCTIAPSPTAQEPSAIPVTTTLPSFAMVSLSPLTSVTPAVLNTSLRTVTPTFVPITPEPTATPLFRAKRILSQDYGQNLTLFIGDTFLLSRFASDDSPLTIDNQHALLAINNTSTASVMLKAVGIGKARVSSLIIVPCPTAPVGCQPPWDYTYVNVTVIDH